MLFLIIKHSLRSIAAVKFEKENLSRSKYSYNSFHIEKSIFTMFLGNILTATTTVLLSHGFVMAFPKVIPQ